VAVPKKKTTSTVRDNRRANWKLKAPALAKCDHCGSPKQPHRVCGTCGYYGGVEVLRPDEF
jgi:large subunit ribosomal protein L32